MCNAAYQMTHDELDAFPGQQITRTFETNVFGPFWLVQALRDELKGGTVIVTTSIQAMEPSSHLLDYASTKAALNNLVVNLAAELGPQGTRVNAVAPGPIWTPLQPSGGQQPEDLPEFGQSTPLGRAGQPTELAPAYVFLASPESSYVLGETLNVNGGMPTP